ncbi:FAD-dependent monooxygenase [Nonomuraea aurantiaca]|uniref:FAD-dependent monooxygenase n=1 Tax=Nonomuraea aurantiaca TaxID=2878562 RepID=UPI001CD9844F|nr:FAD-dependent monooxygenase [Nonomuraea aurantiaca]MCA2220963.1 FAD-dependent monooxygenase [Nonomuraea aurantiaca]
MVGGGPVGLAASIELSRHGISSLLVERHPGTAIFPKARLISTRTMEIFRAWGIAEEVESAGMPREDVLAVGVGTSLASDDFVRAAAAIDRDAPQSPTYTYLCSQDILEVILRRVAESHPRSDVRFATAMTDFHSTADGVTATIEPTTTPDGGSVLVRARYLVAADGSRSGIRERLGIEVVGPPPLGHMVSVMFDADLGALPADRRVALSFLRSDPPCAVEAVDNKRRWMIQTGYDPSAGGSAADFTEEACVAAVRSAVGLPDLPVTIVGVMPWLQQAVVATGFRGGPVFLAGDAAHATTPQGGFGMNCGIQDAHNLAWKLAAVLTGTADAELLATYEVERRPIAVRTVDESLTNALITLRMMQGRLSMGQAIEQQAERRSSEGLILGFHYESAAVVPDGTPDPAPADPYRTYVPTARPGHRAPHVWLTSREGRVSTLDLLGPAFTLMTPTGSGWVQPAKEAAHRLGVTLSVVEISRASESEPDAPLTSPTWADEYGVGDTGAVLVRPDGHVGWRSPGGAASQAALAGALGAILARS